jgi:hypothetical protein
MFDSSLSAAGLHVPFEFGTSDVSSSTILLRLQRPIVNTVVKLRAAHGPVQHTLMAWLKLFASRMVEGKKNLPDR